MTINGPNFNGIIKKIKIFLTQYKWVQCKHKYNHGGNKNKRQREYDKKKILTNGEEKQVKRMFWKYIPLLIFLSEKQYISFYKTCFEVYILHRQLYTLKVL